MSTPPIPTLSSCSFWQGRRKRRALQEADEDAMFAAAVLGFVHDRVSDVGDVLRVVGDTAGGLAGGSIKAVGASVNVRPILLFFTVWWDGKKGEGELSMRGRLGF